MRGAMEEALKVHMKDWRTRRGFAREHGHVIDNILAEKLPALMAEALAPLQYPVNNTDGQPSRDIHYAIPHGDAWDGVGDRMHENVPFMPTVTVLLEEDPVDKFRPMPTSMHIQFPLKPSAVLAASELLSCSFGPGEHRVLMHVPAADTLGSKEAVACNVVLMSRVSAMADFAITSMTPVNRQMLRHGEGLRKVREKVAGKPGWSLRHVRIARDNAAAPASVHPSGCMDGRNMVPDNDI